MTGNFGGKEKFKLGLKHWTGTAIVAVLAGFVIFGLLRGQEILNDFLKSEPTDANLERGELLVLIPSLALTPPATPKPSSLLKLTPKSTLKSSPSLTPTPNPTTLPTPTPTVKSPSPLPSPSLSLTPSPSPTPVPTLSPYYYGPTISPTPSSTLSLTPTPTPIPVPSPTPTPPLSTPTPSSIPGSQTSLNYIVIAEVRITGGPGQTTNDFLKIFNPLSTAFNLKGHRLVKRTKTGTSDTLLKSWTTDAFISAGGYYTWANSSFTGLTPPADVTTSGSIADDNGVAIREGPNDTGTIIDAVAWGAAQNIFVEGSPYPENPGQNQLLKRRFLNGIIGDTNNNGQDFEIIGE